MATSGSSSSTPPPAPASAPSADEALVKKGELTGQVRGPDVDSSFHVYEFEEPKK